MPICEACELVIKCCKVVTCFSATPIRIICKVVNEAGGDKVIYRHISIKRYDPVLMTISDEAAMFLRRCEENGNPESLFRLGMMEYFSKVQINIGLGILKRAVKLGHDEVTYIVGLIYLCGDNRARSQGIQMLNDLSQSKILECRKKSRAIIHRMWINNDLGGEKLVSTNMLCDDCEGERAAKRSRWVKDDECVLGCDACGW
ncbi:hypothetical protein GIB67_038046 [Kingdonia uniflora]|uniref:At2g35280-like TPR domain-containing protein n=1 Tax=Kingdonia uniflora TaxID=39325 RepID=A0A7J7MC04_9MAGN|nr:hypothetical protein GIB67_038046 [Kingdonia uniflora]